MYNSYMYTIFKYKLARESLRHIVRKYKIKKMQIPYYLCSSVRHTLVEEDCKPLFYHIDDNFMPSCDFLSNDYILYPNYFGICTKNVEKLDSLYSNLIVDNAHAFYNKPSGLACFNSAYKFNLGDFSYLWIESDTKSEVIEEKFEVQKNTRIKRFIELNNQYVSENLLNIDTTSIPFVYPLLLDNEKHADEIAKNLMKNGLEIYRYWNPMPKTYKEYKFYSRMVPIPIIV